MIRLGNLLIKNVGPFESEKFDFDVEKEHPDIHIFTGANGTGKTTILHALASIFNVDNDKYLINGFYKRFQKQNSEVEISLISRKTSQIFGKIGATCNYEEYTDNKFIPMLTSHYDFEIPNTFENGEFKKYISNNVKKEILHQTFKFAAFGYSGYRLINSTKIKSIEEFNYNPLYLALEFDKKTDENNNISNWIISRYSKAAIEETHGNKALADKYRTALNCLMNSIEELTDGEFTFAIKTNPWKVVTKYHGNEIEFDVLPDGLRSILSWMGDLLMR